MKATGMTVNSVESMQTLLNSTKKEVNEFCDYLIAEAVQLQARIQAQTKAEGDEAFAQMYGTAGASAAKLVYYQLADAADRGCSMLTNLEKAAATLAKIASAIRAVRARRDDADSLKV